MENISAFYSANKRKKHFIKGEFYYVKIWDQRKGNFKKDSYC